MYRRDMIEIVLKTPINQAARIIQSFVSAFV